MRKGLKQDATSISSHYITNNIRAVYARRLIMPVLLLILLVVLWKVFAIDSFINPQYHDTTQLLTKPDELTDNYIKTDLQNLYFTGYTSTIFGKTTGYYYYTMIEDKCLIVLLSPSSCEEGLPEIPHLTLPCKVSLPDKAYDRLITQLADDIQWTHAGLSAQMTDIHLEESTFHATSSRVFFGICFFAFLYSCVYAVLCLLAIMFPLFSPPCMKLDKFGNAKELMRQAEEELSTLPQLATEDMFITENFFIEISKYGVAIVPIREIIWVYKHSTLHKLFGYHFVISYTLHIVGNKLFYLQCPKNIKSNIDGIIDYLAEANHEILVGFNEENRIKAQELQKRKLHFERIIHFLQKRI